MIKPLGEQEINEQRIGLFNNKEQFFLKDTKEAEAVAKKFIPLLMNRRRMMDEIRRSEKSLRQSLDCKSKENKKTFIN